MPTAQKPSDLIGEPLNGICFVMDYVELSFNGPILRALTPVELIDGGRRTVFPEPGSRDALCGLIEAVLVDLQIEDEKAMTLRFDSGTIVRIPLAYEERAGPEAAHFVPGKGQPIQVW